MLDPTYAPPSDKTHTHTYAHTHTTPAQGALAFKAWNGIFQNKVAIEFWTYVGYSGSGGLNADIPDISIGISGKNVSRCCFRLPLLRCRTHHLLMCAPPSACRGRVAQLLPVSSRTATLCRTPRPAFVHTWPEPVHAPPYAAAGRVRCRALPERQAHHVPAQLQAFLHRLLVRRRAISGWTTLSAPHSLPSGCCGLASGPF